MPLNTDDSDDIRPLPHRRIGAHKLDTIRHADRILFLENGHIVEDGTHDELLRFTARYAQFWIARAAAAGWHLNATDDELSRAADR